MNGMGKASDEEMFGLFPGEPLIQDGACPACGFTLSFTARSEGKPLECPRCDGLINSPYFEQARDSQFFDSHSTIIA